ncbi:rhodanese-like domain-containing protein [Nocardiopsis sp. N85]|uniref:sulfurtransferase n=1 Tax=Nocardiopsis sp. N85 TaxID=3029400 RepID=UPI00237FC7F9|nr:rhodanese-like domain-containing protein [Nocardiopsis sp. N85]MDE3724071.1 rhodanese-like domain-containing protein [Nocardiopsis sp. N85]
MSARIAPVVDAAWLAAHLHDGDLVVVDATTLTGAPGGGPHAVGSGRAGYEAEHVPGALFADLTTDFADTEAPEPWTVPSSEKFAVQAGLLGIGVDSRVVVYDRSTGFWATRLHWQLRLEGFDDVAVLDGGLRAWKSAGERVTADPTPDPIAAAFQAERRPELLRSTEEVAKSLDDPGTVLVAVLDPDARRGEVRAYAREGHIPGSVVLPPAEILDPATGGPRPVGELRATFERAGLLDPGVTPVAYSGHGIAATGVAYALVLAGRDDVAVYDGSMAAWAADDSLPLVTGDSPGGDA